MNTETRTVPGMQRRSLHLELAEAMQEMIVTGQLPPGSKVPEKQLCESFGVSRTPLREALKVLAAERLVILEPHRGAWVSKITVADLEEVFPVMGAFEALAGELACRSITDEEIAEVRRLHERMIACYEQRDLQGYFEANQKIHEAILVAARNETLIAQYRALATQVRRARFIANMTQERWKQATEEHEEIMACLEARDGERLARVLQRHLQNKLETVRTWLKANEPRAGPSAG